MSICYPYVIPVAAGASYDTATTAWINAVVSAGGTVSDTQKSRVDALIVGLKADGLFTILDRLWLFGGESVVQQATIDIIALESNSLVNAPPLSAGGYTGNSSNRAINTNFIPPSAGGNFVSQGSSFGFSTSTTGSGGDNTAHGCFDGANCLCDINLISGANAICRLNRSGGNSVGAANSDRKGIWIGVSSGASAQEFYRNGSLFASSGAQAAEAITNLPAVYFLARNDNGTPSSHNSDLVSTGFIGGELDATQAANLTTHIETYLDAWGIGVI